MIASSCRCVVSWHATRKRREISSQIWLDTSTSLRAAQQLDKLRNEVYPLDEALGKAHRDNCVLAEALQEKLDDNDSLTKI